MLPATNKQRDDHCFLSDPRGRNVPLILCTFCIGPFRIRVLIRETSYLHLSRSRYLRGFWQPHKMVGFEGLGYHLYRVLLDLSSGTQLLFQNNLRHGVL